MKEKNLKKVKLQEVFDERTFQKKINYTFKIYNLHIS